MFEGRRSSIESFLDRSRGAGCGIIRHLGHWEGDRLLVRSIGSILILYLEIPRSHQ